MTLILNKFQELFPRLRGGPHATEHAAGDGLRRGLLHTAHHHTQVARLDYDSYALWF